MGEFLHDKPVVPRTDEEKQAVINRLKRIEGQVRGIERMVDEDRYCIDILVQIKAINAALNKVGNTITERHIKHCISSAVKNDDGDKAIDELLKVIQHVSK
ncbi:MAG TPA: metal-sensitive transcriptional regulator [Erysipelotrichaceae bacterium]|nr:metal-sensitive transcriptional regulator [Erysipelotrichaceae bacterium]